MSTHETWDSQADLGNLVGNVVGVTHQQPSATRGSGAADSGAFLRGMLTIRRGASVPRPLSFKEAIQGLAQVKMPEPDRKKPNAAKNR